MTSTIAIMLLLGCTPDLQLCREVNLPPVTYLTASACETDIEGTTRSIKGFPVVIGKCVPVEGFQPAGTVKVNWYFDRARQLTVRAATASPAPAPAPVLRAAVPDGAIATAMLVAGKS